MRTTTNILLCEDDINLASVMSEYLRAHNYSVTHTANGQEGLEAAQSKAYDLCLLDVRMPLMSGLDMLRELRACDNNLPVIILSQHGEKEDMLAGYEAGCDDYMLKPVSMDILICKIEAIMRRIRIVEDDQQTVYQLGNISFDSVKQRLGKEHLSGRENDLLLMLCRKSNRVVERSQILKALWQTDNYFASRSLSVYINHLRHMIGNIPNVRIVAIHGKGYKLITE